MAACRAGPPVVLFAEFAGGFGGGEVWGQLRRDGSAAAWSGWRVGIKQINSATFR
jgi:hypothetical protein